MKDVVRRKLCVATSVPIYLSQERDGQSVALEDGTFAKEWVAVFSSQIFFSQMRILTRFMPTRSLVTLFK